MDCYQTPHLATFQKILILSMNLLVPFKSTVYQPYRLTIEKAVSSISLISQGAT